MTTPYFCCFFFLLLVAHQGFGSPKGRSRTNLDQKQTGDYNIRLSLKDFQIIALLGEDSIGDIGNLDYNYDYSELTVKPTTGSSSTSTTTFSPPIFSTETPKPTIKPVSTETGEQQASSTTTTTTTSTTTQKPSSFLTEDRNNSSISSTSTQKTTTLKKKDEDLDLPAGQIPVFVQIPKKEAAGINNRRNVQTVSILPSSSHEKEEDLQQANQHQQRKCPGGHARDKRGRCKKLRRPTFPFELARIASSLAARLSPIPQEGALIPDDSTEE